MQSGCRTLQLSALVPCNIPSRHHQPGTWGTPTPFACWASQLFRNVKHVKTEMKTIKHKPEGLPGMPRMVCCNLSLPVRFGKLWMDCAHPWRVYGNNVQPAAWVIMLRANPSLQPNAPPSASFGANPAPSHRSAVILNTVKGKRVHTPEYEVWLYGKAGSAGATNDLCMGQW